PPGGGRRCRCSAAADRGADPTEGRRGRVRAGASALVRRDLRHPRVAPQRIGRRPRRHDRARRRPLASRGMSLFKALTRILAIVGKELVTIVRRPGALLSLVLGPFLIMALFGLGYSGYRRPLDTIVVIPPSTGLSTDPKTYQDV